MINFNFQIPQSYSTTRPTFNLSPSIMGTAQQNPFKLTSLTDNIIRQSNTDLTKQQIKTNGTNAIAAQSLSALGSQLGSFMQPAFGDEEAGQVAGSLVGSAVGTTFSKMGDNLLKGISLQEGLSRDVGASVAGVGAGIAGNYIGKGINSLGGDSRLSRGLGAATASGIGSFGGMMASNAIKGQALFKGLSSGNLVGMAGNAVGAGLSVAFGPSREYNGRYGKITKGIDTAYDTIQTGIGFVPGWGQLASGMMALNKGLSNVFGSTDGMSVQDAILGSAFMPAPVKWLNMAGARTTEGFKNQSWQNTEKTDSFMQNAYGNLRDRFDKAREEGGRTYGTFSRRAYKKAQANVNHANDIWNQILALADQNELQNIRSQYMTSINNQRYAQNIQGGFSPLARGKQGMKILNNATNHNMGMRLLSAAALIDDKQMILSAQQ